ncbi:hypothetical protein JXB41_03140 [Candidatus Woesearchaeota archaeon]|nr:hypothetical protein [Candidatus Woesearchaeota archaeon]
MKLRVFLIIILLTSVLLIVEGAVFYCGVEDPDGINVKQCSVSVDFTQPDPDACNCVWTINCQKIGWYQGYTWTDDSVNWVQGSNTNDATHTHTGTTYADRDNSNLYYCECSPSIPCATCQECSLPSGQCDPSVAGTGPCNSIWLCTSNENTNNAYGVGYGYETQGYCDGTGDCDRSGSGRDPDTYSSACECLVTGTQSTCGNAETGCWDSSQAECCGDDGSSDDWCDGISYAACVDGTYSTDADTYAAVCECGVSGVQGTCGNAETGCWDSSQSECCGDDGSSDDWCDGISYSACVDGTYRTDADTYSAICECGVSGTQGSCNDGEVGCWDSSAGKCCGDDSGEDHWEATQQGSGGTGACCGSGYNCVDSANNCMNEYPTETSCDDSIDNDCDGQSDCNDADCTAFCSEICNNGVDDDGDTYVDCADDECTQGTSCSSGFCCGSQCNINGGSCSCTSVSGIACIDGTCNTYGEPCCSSQFRRALQCSGTSLVCTNGDNLCEASCDSGVISQCDGHPSGYDIEQCNLASEAYFGDECSASCTAQEMGDNICRGTAYGADCTGSAFCNGRFKGDEDLNSDECCNNACQTVDCDNYDDTDKEDGILTESEVSGGTCIPSCTNGGCCDIQTVKCNSTNEFKYVHNLITNADELLNYICYNNGTAWKWGDPGEIDAEILTIHNMGLTGFEETNPEFTSVRTVYLELIYLPGTETCRYINFDNPSVRPGDDLDSWLDWENCNHERYWQLSENAGSKTVYVQINYSTGSQVVMNDSIYYNSSGAGLDTSPPSAPLITVGGYTNNNESIKIKWEPAYDYESVEILGIPIIYEVFIFDHNNVELGNTSTFETEYVFSGLNLAHGEEVTAEVSAVNSAGLKNTSTSEKIIIDLVPPYYISIVDYLFYDLATDTYKFLNEDDWFNTRTVQFTWVSDDADSRIGAYSYILSKSDKLPDDVPEGTIGNFQNEINHTFSGIPSGAYYFNVKSRDKAGNWRNNYDSYFVHIDNTLPSRPEIISEYFDALSQSITYTWSASDDQESGIADYMLNLTYEDGSPYRSIRVNDTSYPVTGAGSDTYIALIGAMNGAGIWRWSNQEEIITDFDPPEINTSLGGIIITQEPIIWISTNEKATCYYNHEGMDRKFAYTNSTYHEAKVKLAGAGSQVIYINCTDPYGNFDDSFSITLDVQPDYLVENVDIPDTLEIYQDQFVFFTLTVSDSLNRFLGGIYPDSFQVKLNDEEIDFSVFETGYGQYDISFISPSFEGDYIVQIYVNSNMSNDLNLDLKPLSLDIVYNPDEPIVPTASTRLVYYKDENGYFGLASEDENAQIDPSKINLSSNFNENLFIFSTRANANLNQKQKYLNKKDFLESINPSFGYTSAKKYFLNIILKYDDIDILVDQPIEIERTNKYIIKKTKSVSGRRTLYIDKLA